MFAEPAATSRFERPVQGSGALDLAVQIARLRIDLGEKRKGSQPGARRDKIDEALRCLDEAADLLMDPKGPHVGRAAFLIDCAKNADV